VEVGESSLLSPLSVSCSDLCGMIVTVEGIGEEVVAVVSSRLACLVDEV
jgi:hypothetical protein